MMALMFLAEPQGGGQIETIARTFGVDWPHLTAQIVSFSIVCALLYWLAYRPVLRMLAVRREQIAQGLANAAQIKAELARTEVSRQEVLARARLEGAKLIEDAQAAAVTMHAQETEKAAVSAAQIVTRAHEAAEQDRRQMLADLRREVGRLVVETTATVTGKILTPEDHRRLAEETARQLQA
jgi:F-type H+-transporting ATPase subunit b